MKRSPLKRKSKSKIKKLQDKLWNECKRITREQHGNTCYTCGASGLEGSNWQTGHMWAKASLSTHLKYDLRVLRPQCMRCNLRLGGLGAIFFIKMREEKGDKHIKQIIKDMHVDFDKKQVYSFYEYLIETYKKL